MPKISDLVLKSNLSPTDILPLVDYSDPLNPVTKKSTLAEVRGNIYVKTLYYSNVSTRTGEIEIPENAEFIYDSWANGVDILVSETDSQGIPTYKTPIGNSGEFITATLDGAAISSTFGYELSDNFTGTLSIIYSYRIIYWKFDYTKSLGEDVIIENIIEDDGIHELVSEYTGYVENKKPKFAYSYSAPTVSIFITNTTTRLFNNEIFEDDPWSLDVVPVDGEEYFVSYIEDGTVTVSNTFWGLENISPVIHFWWDSGILMGLDYEAHGAIMDWKTHYNNHTTRGTQISPGGFELSYTYNDQVNNIISLSDGKVQDEDNIFTVTNTFGYNTDITNYPFHQRINPTLYVPVYFRTGESWNKKPADKYPFNYVGDIPKYNLNDGSSWTLTDVPESYYFSTWICVGGDLFEPIFAIQGQKISNNLNTMISTDLWQDTDITTFKNSEFKVLYRVTYQYSSSYNNTPKVIVVNVRDYRTENCNNTQKLSLIDSVYSLTSETRYLPSELSVTSSYSPVGTTSTIGAVSYLDDGQYVLVEENLEPDLTMTFSGVSSFNKVVLNGFYTGNGIGSYIWNPLIYDFISSSFVELATISGKVAGSDIFKNGTVGIFTLKSWDIINPNRYISGGTVVVKLDHGNLTKSNDRAGLDYAALIQSGAGAGVTNHGELSGLTALDHPARAIYTVPYGNLAGLNVRDQLYELEDEKVNLQQIQSTLDGTLGYATITFSDQIIKLLIDDTTVTISPVNWPTTKSGSMRLIVYAISGVGLPDWSNFTPIDSHFVAPTFSGITPDTGKGVYEIMWADGKFWFFNLGEF